MVLRPDPPDRPNVGQRVISKDNVSRAVLTLLFSSLSFSLVGVSVRLAGDVPVYEKVLIRSVVTLVVLGAIAARRGQRLFERSPRLPLLILRGVFGTTAMALYFYAISNLTLADATILNKLSPFFVVIFACLFLRERLPRFVIPTLVVAFIGAGLVIQPQLDLRAVPAVAGLVSAIASGAAYTAVRSLRGREAPYKIVFYFALVSVIVMLPPTIGRFVMPTPLQFVSLLAAGVFGTIGQLLLTLAFHQAPASRISIYNYAHVVFAFLLAWGLWGEIPDALSITGMALIISAAIYNHRKTVREGEVPGPA